MLMIIFVLWVIFALVCAVLVEVYEHEFFGFLFLLSLPLMFYVPFMVSVLFQLPFYFFGAMEISDALRIASYVGFSCVIVGYIDYLRR